MCTIKWDMYIYLIPLLLLNPLGIESFGRQQIRIIEKEKIEKYRHGEAVEKV